MKSYENGSEFNAFKLATHLQEPRAYLGTSCFTGRVMGHGLGLDHRLLSGSLPLTHNAQHSTSKFMNNL